MSKVRSLMLGTPRRAPHRPRSPELPGPPASMFLKPHPLGSLADSWNSRRCELQIFLDWLRCPLQEAFPDFCHRRNLLLPALGACHLPACAGYFSRGLFQAEGQGLTWGGARAQLRPVFHTCE